MTVFRRDQDQIAVRQAADLQAAKIQAVAAINAEAGLTRQKYITTLPGQDMIYIAKEREALAYLATPPDVSLGDLSAYPMLAAEVGLTAPTARELAQVWANVSFYWRGIAAQIEGSRMRAIAGIENCKDTDQIAAIRSTFRPL